MSISVVSPSFRRQKGRVSPHHPSRRFQRSSVPQSNCSVLLRAQCGFDSPPLGSSCGGEIKLKTEQVMEVELWVSLVSNRS
ncbi:unnamed protein product [Musa hybrid cultivar]